MKKVLLRFSIALLTFIIGVGAAALWSWSRYPSTEKLAEQRAEVIVQTPSATKSIPPRVPVGWYKVDANGLFTFYLPKSMKLGSREMSLESRWGSSFSDKRIRLFAEYTSWPEAYAREYLAKQFDYEKRRIEISGRKAMVHHWRWADPSTKNKYQSEARIYDARGELLIRMEAACVERRDVDTAEQIFETIQVP